MTKKKGDLPEINSGYDEPHKVIKGDPRIDGPYLDDLRAAQEDARREARTKYFDKADMATLEEVALAEGHSVPEKQSETKK